VAVAGGFDVPQVRMAVVVSVWCMGTVDRVSAPRRPAAQLTLTLTLTLMK